MDSFIHSLFQKYLLSIYHVPGTFLGISNMQCEQNKPCLYFMPVSHTLYMQMHAL